MTENKKEQIVTLVFQEKLAKSKKGAPFMVREAVMPKETPIPSSLVAPEGNFFVFTSGGRPFTSKFIHIQSRSVHYEPKKWSKKEPTSQESQQGQTAERPPTSK